MSQETQIQVEKSINASPSQIYYAFTNSTALREWMCDFATTDPKAGGRFIYGGTAVFMSVLNSPPWNGIRPSPSPGKDDLTQGLPR
jgi:hypothetical protein